ncbi:unnamed protein product [Psylliodes chrysocephalus]|uniref:Uncharacterized protein n=1 Tax=Psylliodes chrysocephalus TaxID=3402493 RepID=A0A9P0CRH0_9CUCU|nr:unnamed protein product [Psylliodes chrysocephala]
MKTILCLVSFLCTIQHLVADDVRLLDLEPPDAKQVIEKQDQSLHYAPKVDSNVPAVRYLGNEPHDVQEDIYLARQYHGQDGVGGYLYGYNIPDIAKTEKKVAGGDLRGAYNYIAQDGQEIKVEYWDDGTGFHQIDNVPKILPKQIEDSPEVKAEKDKFLARWHEEAERNQHPVTEPYDSNGNYASGPLSLQGQLEAKKQFAAQYPQTSYQQPGSYQQSSYSQSSGQYQQPGQYQSSGQGQYQSSSQSSQSKYQNQYPQSQQSGQSQFQQSGQNQYQQPGQHQQSGGQYQQPGQYQQSGQGQYQQPGQYQQSGQGQYQKPGPSNQIDYSGQYSENQNVYSNPSQNKKPGQYEPYNSASQYSQTTQYQQGGKFSNPNEVDNSGQYNEKSEEENGPPKGFFYSYDYPVGKIVSVGGIARVGELKNAYDQNKSKYESQLHAGGSGTGGTQSSYSYSH